MLIAAIRGACDHHFCWILVRAGDQRSWRLAAWAAAGPRTGAHLERLVLTLPQVGAAGAQVRHLPGRAHARYAARRRHAASSTALEITARSHLKPAFRRRDRADTRAGTGRAGRSDGAWPHGAVFPDVAVKMIEVGESTGALQEMLNSLADFYDEEIETAVGRFITVIEPALLVVMGVIIAGRGAGALHAALRARARWPEAWVSWTTSHRPSAAATADPTNWWAHRGPAQEVLRAQAWPSATAWNSSTWTTSGSTRSCSARFRPT